MFFFITSSVSAAIDFDSPCYSVPENKYYYEYGGQCTAFAWGRTCETTGIKLEFEIQSYPSAKYWYEYGPIDSLNLQLGSDIRPNSIAIWEGDTANPYGHVAYIERVEGGIVYFNEANVETYDGSTWGGGYDGYEKSSTIYNFEHRGTGVGNILGYLYLITEEPEFYLLSGTITNADGDPVPGWVYASETTGANLGNRVYSSDGIYEMALFPGTYRVHAQAYHSYPSGYYYIRTPFQTIAISVNSTLNRGAVVYAVSPYREGFRYKWCWTGQYQCSSIRQHWNLSKLYHNR